MMPCEMVFLDRKCRECGNKVVQAVFFRMENEAIRMQSYWKDCLVCHAVLPKPTENEIRESPYLAT
jgi:ribosomal protein S27E